MDQNDRIDEMKRIDDRSYYEEKSKKSLLKSLSKFLTASEYEITVEKELYNIANSNWRTIKKDLNQFKMEYKMDSIQISKIDLTNELMKNLREKTNQVFNSENVTLDDRINLINDIEESYKNVEQVLDIYQGFLSKKIVRNDNLVQEMDQIDKFNEFLIDYTEKLGFEPSRRTKKISDYIEEKKEEARLEKEREENLKEEKLQKSKQRELSASEAMEKLDNKLSENQNNSFNVIFEQENGNLLSKYQISKLIKDHHFEAASLKDVNVKNLAKVSKKPSPNSGGDFLLTFAKSLSYSIPNTTRLLILYYLIFFQHNE